MREKILAVIEKNSRIDLKDLAVLLGESEIAVANEIAEMEKEHIICGYHTLINWDNTSEEKVVALIEVKVTMESVLSTATHFVLKKYKDHGTIISEQVQDERMLITP